MSFTGSRAVADEAVAETFAHLRRGTVVRSPAAWVWKAAFRIAVGELHRSARVGVAVADTGSYELADSLPEVIAALASLPPVQRVVVVLHDYADRPTGEIAEALGIARRPCACTSARRVGSSVFSWRTIDESPR
jgi:DNA-directed RNA polymerase specialized sigma24 family protein